MASKVLSIILAGGEGKRLMPLTHFRAKPAVPFGGTYRLIDFPLSNLINSGYRHTFILTQYKSQSLARHIASSWAMSPITGEFTSIVPAQQTRGDHWYLGSADAIYQTLNLIADYDPDIILILGADNVYRMDYSQMIEEHIKSGAEFTITGIRQPIELADQFGVIQTCDNDPHKIEQFLEKPKNAKGLPDNPNEVYASMGNYVANADVFIEALKKDAESLTSNHDMGGDIVPYFVNRKSAYVYDFKANSVPGDNPKDRGYWRDVGTIDQYFEANMDLIAIDPTFNLYNFEWPIITSQTGLPPAKFVHDEQNRKGVATNSIVSQGAIISGGHVSNSVLSPRVKINSWADVHRSILFDNVYVGRKAQIKNTIIDKNSVIASGIQIGYDLDLDRKRGLTVTDSGIVVVPKNTIIEK